MAFHWVMGTLWGDGEAHRTRPQNRSSAAGKTMQKSRDFCGHLPRLVTPGVKAIRHQVA